MKTCRLANGNFVFIPDICDRHSVPYRLGNFPQREEELLNMFDPASISVTLSKKLSLPIGRLRCWLHGANTNAITGTYIHSDVESGEELELRGYILTSYCGFGVHIAVLCTKDSAQDWLKDFPNVETPT